MSDDATERWAELGRMLMRFRLEEAAASTATSLRQTAGKIERGEEITSNDVEHLYLVFETGEDAVDELASVVEEEFDEE